LSIFATKETHEQQNSEAQPKVPVKKNVWLVAATWALAALMVALAIFSLYQYFTGKSLLAFVQTISRSSAGAEMPSSMPAFSPTGRHAR
jgi:hypothetical protein